MSHRPGGFSIIETRILTYADRVFSSFYKKNYALKRLECMVLSQWGYDETLTGLAYYKKALYFHIGKWVDLRRKAPIVEKKISQPCL